MGRSDPWASLEQTLLFRQIILSNPDRLCFLLVKLCCSWWRYCKFDDYYNGYAVRFVDGNAVGIVAEITDYVGADNKIIYGSITGATPDVGDKYKFYL